MEDKQICKCCNKLTKNEDYYSSASFFMKNNGRVHVCKPCIWEYVEPVRKNLYEMGKVEQVLRMIDKPFLRDLWESSVTESDKKNGDYFKTYMKNLALPHNRELSWNDSEFKERKIEELTEQEELELLDEDIKLTELDMKRFKRLWGDFTVDDYIFLENFYGEYETNFPTDTPAQVNIYRNLAKIHLQAEKELAKGNVKLFKDLMDLSSKMHTDGNIKPIQSSGMNDDKGLSTYGLWIKTVENEEPCEYFKDKATYEDFDGFRKYIEKWFVRPLKNIFNVSKDFDVKDD